MNENERGRQPRRYRGGLFWPVVLIAVGVVFLLDNLGLMTGDLWDNILRLWPVLLIVIGLDGILRRQGIVGGSLMIGLGVVFLLNNYGFLALNVWQVVLNLWPLLLIAVGFDILIGHRSKLLAALGLIVMLALLVGALWMMQSKVLRGQALEGEQIRQELGDASRARVVIEVGYGTLGISDLPEPVALIMGTIPPRKNIPMQQEFSVQGGTASFTLQGVEGTVAISPDVYYWDLQLNAEIPIDLEVALGMGDATLELTDLDLSALAFDMGLGQATLLLPAQGRLEGKVDMAIGELVLMVPEGMGLRLYKDTALVAVSLPDDYRLEDGVYTSPDYTSADQRIELRVDMAIGRLVIREK